jgi:hypothetical protein
MGKKIVPRFGCDTSSASSHRQLLSFGQPNVDDDTLNVETNIGPDEI